MSTASEAWPQMSPALWRSPGSTWLSPWQPHPTHAHLTRCSSHWPGLPRYRPRLPSPQPSQLSSNPLNLKQGQPKHRSDSPTLRHAVTLGSPIRHLPASAIPGGSEPPPCRGGYRGRHVSKLACTWTGAGVPHGPMSASTLPLLHRLNRGSLPPSFICV